MIDEPKIIPLQSLPVTIVGTGDGGTPTTGTIAVTPGTQANLIVNVIGPVMALAVRFINLFLVTLSGMIGAAITPMGDKLLRADDFGSLVVSCSVLALSAAAFGSIKDLVTIFGKLERKYPLLTGSV